MKVVITPTRRVICEATIQLPLSAGAVWGQLRDLRSSASHDYFHSRIDIDGGVPRAGVQLRIEHRYLFFSTVRVGRILRWEERIGYAFSDLCQRDSRRAFPHMLSYRVKALTESSCAVRIRLSGRWTFPGPIWIGRIWLWWVFSHMVRTTTNQLLMFAVAIRPHSAERKA